MTSIQSDNQALDRVIAQMQAHLLDSAPDFAFVWAKDSLQVSKGGVVIKTFPAPVKVGAVYNAIQRFSNQSPLESLPQVIGIGPYHFDPRRSHLISADDQDVIVLTDKERDILVALWRAPDKSLTREALLDAVWAYAQGVETHTLETHIYRLRQKMEADPGTPDWLVNVDGLYRLNA